MKILLNPLIISAFIVTLLLGSVAHLMYGSCQSSKWHYMMQYYWVPKGLYKWIPKDHSEAKSYTGQWNTWFQSGAKFSESEMKDGLENGIGTLWFDNGTKYVESEMKDGLVNGKSTIWHENGVKWVEGSFKDGEHNGLSVTWNKDGTLNKKDYYDEKGNFQKRELFEKGKLVKTEVVE